MNLNRPARNCPTFHPLGVERVGYFSSLKSWKVLGYFFLLQFQRFIANCPELSRSIQVSHPPSQNKHYRDTSFFRIGKVHTRHAYAASSVGILSGSTQEIPQGFRDANRNMLKANVQRPATLCWLNRIAVWKSVSRRQKASRRIE